MTRVSIAALAAIMFAAAPAANAAQYVFTSSLPLSGGGTVAGAGTITADDSLSTSADGYYSGFRARSITGTYFGANITGLVPVNTKDGNDNLVDTSGGALDYNGIGFELDRVLPGYAAVGDYVNTVVNLYTEDGFWFTDNGPTGYGSFTIAAVPEPATWAMMIVGLGGVGYALRQRRRTAETLAMA